MIKYIYKILLLVGIFHSAGVSYALLGTWQGLGMLVAFFGFIYLYDNNPF